jgi:radical SAM protein with 4Fe4S-binding SPASM domain
VPRAPTFQELDRSCVIPKEFLAGYTKSNKDINYSQAEKRLYSKKIIEIADKYNIDERDISKKIMQAIKIGGCLHHCPAGICKISVTPDGSIYPCHQFVNINPYYMGNIFKRRSNLYERVSKRLLNRTVFKLDKCGKCVFQTICPPLIDCPARSYHEKKSLYKTPQYCEMYYKYVERTFERFLKELMGGYNGKMGKDSGFFLYL